MTNFSIGALAGGISGALTVPMQTILIRYQNVVSTPPEAAFSSYRQTIRTIYKIDSIPGFYAGFVPSLAGIIVYRGTYFGLFDTGKAMIGNSSSVLSMFAMAQIVTLTAGCVSYPLATITVRLKMDAGREHKNYTGMWDCARKMIAKEGNRSLFRGLPFTLLTGTGGALLLVLNDKMNSV